MIRKFIVFAAITLSVLLWGNYIGNLLPHELPPVKSVITEKLMEVKTQSEVDIKEYESLTNKKGLAKMFVTYNLAALESSYNRQIDLKSDILLFFDIAVAIPEDTIVTMFYFRDNHIDMDYNEPREKVELFCNNLAKSGHFSEVYYEELDNMVKITVNRM